MQIFYEAEFELKYTCWLALTYPHKTPTSTLTLLTPTPDPWRVDQPLHITMTVSHLLTPWSLQDLNIVFLRLPSSHIHQAYQRFLSSMATKTDVLYICNLCLVLHLLHCLIPELLSPFLNHSQFMENLLCMSLPYFLLLYSRWAETMSYNNISFYLKEIHI